MLTLNGYHIKSKIHESSNSMIYKAERIFDNLPVIIKLIVGEYPDVNLLKNLKNEHKILSKLSHIQGIIKIYDIHKYNTSPIIVMEDINGISLDKIIENDKFDLITFLDIAIQTTEILNEIHNNSFIHKDIKPHNIIYNKKTKELRIIDFNLSTQIDSTLNNEKNKNIIGTYAYIAPEQTTLIDSNIDYRADFYSLGATFYHLVTGKLPFDHNEIKQLINAHICRQPVSPIEINPGIPKTLSSIIMKLLSKSAEQRYQSAYGIILDLKECLKQLKTCGRIKDFTIAKDDIPQFFKLPDTFFGRKTELHDLLNIFRNVQNGHKKLVFISGPSGIGKTSLINTFKKTLPSTNNYFINGKFDIQKTNIPYTAIIKAFQDLTNIILTENDDHIEHIKKQILKNVGNLGKVLLNIIPKLKFIIGSQPEVDELVPIEAQHRFKSVFSNFIKALATKNKPLILFLDDIQWSDTASLTILETLITDNELQYIYLICTYRDNEIPEPQQLNSFIKKLNEKEIRYNDITLKPLNKNNINQLIAATLHKNHKETLSLTELISTKTAGNPFYIKFFLKSLADNKLLIFENGWKWNRDKIEHAEITNNVVDLIIINLNKLPNKTLQILKQASCIGTYFTINTLCTICLLTEYEVNSNLQRALTEGIIKKKDDYLIFTHNKIKETLYSLLSENERSHNHYTIGMTLLEATNYTNKDIKKLYYIANQLNFAKNLLDIDEKKILLNINLKAGKEAKDANAYEAAIAYYNNCIELLPDNSWNNNYKITLQIYKNLAELNFIERNYQNACDLFKLILTNAQTVLHKIEIYILQIEFYTLQMKLMKAMEIGNKACEELSLPFPNNPNKKTMTRTIKKIKKNLNEKKINNLLHSPEMSDPEKIAAINIISKCFAPAYISGSLLFPALVIAAVDLMITYGNTMISPYVYMLFGSTLIASQFNDIENGLNFSKLAMELVKKYNNTAISGKTLFHFIWINHMKSHLNNNIKYCSKIIRHCHESGDYQYLAYTYITICYIHFLSGKNLLEVKKIFHKYSSKIYNLKQPQTELYFNLWRLGINTLTGETEDINYFQKMNFNEDPNIIYLRETHDICGQANYTVISSFVYYIFEKYSDGFNIADENENNVAIALMGQPIVQFYYFIYALLITAHYNSFNQNKKKKYMNKLMYILKQFSIWSKYNKYNYLHKYLLIKAEINRITNSDINNTKQLYNDAIKIAEENDFTHEKAIACECAAKFYISLDIQSTATEYLRIAYHTYQIWGCSQKVMILENKYNILLNI